MWFQYDEQGENEPEPEVYGFGDNVDDRLEKRLDRMDLLEQRLERLERLEKRVERLEQEEQKRKDKKRRRREKYAQDSAMCEDASVEMRGLRQANDQLTEAYVPSYFGYAGLRLSRHRLPERPVQLRPYRRKRERAFELCMCVVAQSHIDGSWPVAGHKTMIKCVYLHLC